MLKTGIYRELMHEIFSDLYVASRIAINCHCGADIDIFIGTTQLEIDTVNRCKTPKAFGKQIRHACNQLIDRAMVKQAGLQPAERSAFLMEVNNNFEPLISKVLQPPGKKCSSAIRNKEAGEHRLFDIFSTNICVNEKMPKDLEETVRSLAWQYAHAWRKAIKETREQIRLLASLVNYLPVQPLTEIKPSAESKIIVRSNVQRLALLARIFFENNSFTIRNKTVLCNNLCRNFSTTSRDLISPVSFKNKFDCPDKNAIEYWIAELTGLLRIARQIKNRYS